MDKNTQILGQWINLVGHVKSLLWQKWRKFVDEDKPGGERAPLPDGWLKKKSDEWKEMKRKGEIDIDNLSVTQVIPYKTRYGRLKPGRKRGRRKKKNVKQPYTDSVRKEQER